MARAGACDSRRPIRPSFRTPTRPIGLSGSDARSSSGKTTASGAAPPWPTSMRCSATDASAATSRRWRAASPSAGLALPDHVKPFTDLDALSMLAREPPAHTRLRRLVNRAFVSRSIERLRPRVAGLAMRPRRSLSHRRSFRPAAGLRRADPRDTHRRTSGCAGRGCTAAPRMVPPHGGHVSARPDPRDRRRGRRGDARFLGLSAQRRSPSPDSPDGRPAQPSRRPRRPTARP